MYTMINTQKLSMDIWLSHIANIKKQENYQILKQKIKSFFLEILDQNQNEYPYFYSSNILNTKLANLENEQMIDSYQDLLNQLADVYSHYFLHHSLELFPIDECRISIVTTIEDILIVHYAENKISISYMIQVRYNSDIIFEYWVF